MGILRKNKVAPFTKQKAFMFFATVADVGSLFMAMIYIAYVGLMMIMGLGVEWLNWVMFFITIAYIGFFFFKIFYLNKTMMQTGRMKRIVKMSNKYTKLGMRLINAAFVILSLIGVQLGESHTFALIGLLIVGITFVVSILWDIGNFIVRRKVQDFLVAWNQLSQEEKSERIELLVSGFLRSINNAAIFDDYFDVGLNIKRMVGTKLGDRIRISDARRIESPQEEVGEYNNEDYKE